MIVVPQWIEAKGLISMVSIRPIHPTMHINVFMISKRGQVLIVKDWNKIVKDHREVLGGSN